MNNVLIVVWSEAAIATMKNLQRTMHDKWLETRTTGWYHISTPRLPLRLQVSKMVKNFSCSHFIFYFFFYFDWFFRQHQSIVTKVLSSYCKHFSINKIYIYLHKHSLLHVFFHLYCVFYINVLIMLFFYFYW